MRQAKDKLSCCAGDHAEEEPMRSEYSSNAERALATVHGESLTPFDEAEYARRLVRVRAEMARRNIDTLIVSDPANLYYLSGYQCTWYQDGMPASWFPGSCIAIRQDRDGFIYFEDLDEIIINRMTSIAKDVRPLYTSIGERTEVGPDDNIVIDGQVIVEGELFPGTAIARQLKAEGWLDGNVALELWAYRPSRGYSEMLERALREHGTGTIKDGTAVVNAARRIKSPAEIAMIRNAARLTDLGLEAATKEMRPGVTEIDVWAEADYAMAKAGGDVSAIQKMIGSGPKSHCLHASASRRRLRSGDIVNMDVSGVFNRYHANAARCFSLGEPSRAVRQWVDKINLVFDAVSGTLRPGVAVLDVLRAGQAVAEVEGIWNDVWFFGGYELGIGFPPCWVGNFTYEERITRPDDTFEPGFVGNFEFNFYLPECAGIRELIDTFVVTDDKVEWIHATPTDIIVTE